MSDEESFAELSQKRGVVRRGVEALVDLGSRFPLVLLAVALVTLFGSFAYASKIELRSDFRELLPLESKAVKAFEHQLGRVGGGASLIVVVESPDRGANERFIDAISAKLQSDVATQKECLAKCAPTDAACTQKCGPVLISYLETGTKDVRKFFQDHKWLYADLADLEKADSTLDHQIALRSGAVSNLFEDDEPKVATDGGAAVAIGDAGAADPNAKRPALGMDEFHDRWESKANKSDDFPTGYFATEDGKMMGLRIVSPTTGTGDRGGDLLMARVRGISAELDLKKFHPEMAMGFAGDIPNAIAEKESIMSEAVVATGIATFLILSAIVIFFRSPWSLPVIALPVFMGVGAAYAFATWRYGYVNTSGAFLGAIILGNGINYPIVLLSRYREFRARGMDPSDARRGAVWNAFRAELVGAGVGAIAYGSLTVTDFRGFSQFGMIGFVGMLLVWLSMIPVVPAMIVIVEWVQARLPSFLRDPQPRIDADGSKGFLMKGIARITERAPKLWLGLAVVLTIAAAVKLPGYLRDPWEYNFDRLGSRGSKKSGGVGEWSNKAEKVFGGKMNIAGAMMLADTPEQVPQIRDVMLANDAKDPAGKLINEIVSVDGLLPGPSAEQKKKLEVLDSIRSRLSERVLQDMPEAERKRLLELRPPDDIREVVAKDLPGLLRRRFEENDGRVGTVFYVKFVNLSFSDGHILLRIAKTTDNVKLPDGTTVQTASRSTIFAEMIRSMERDGPLATFLSLIAVGVVVILATMSRRGAVAVLGSLIMGVVWMVGGAAYSDIKLNFLNFIALPITFGIGAEYPFNVFDRSRLLGGDVSLAIRRTGGAVALCSFTTTVGYGSLIFADNQALQSFGQLAMTGEVFCLIAALIVLPSLLHVWKVKKHATSASK